MGANTATTGNHHLKSSPSPLRSSSSSSSLPVSSLLIFDSVMENIDVLQRIVEYIGPKQYRFVLKSVSEWFDNTSQCIHDKISKMLLWWFGRCEYRQQLPWREIVSIRRKIWQFTGLKMFNVRLIVNGIGRRVPMRHYLGISIFSNGRLKMAVIGMTRRASVRLWMGTYTFFSGP